MHELSKGKEGSFKNLPKYNDDQLRAAGLLDFEHFQDELQMGKFNREMYNYNADTGAITLNPNYKSNVPSTQETFISRYTPSYLSKARSEYADMIHGLNEKNQSQIDNYNTNLFKEISSYGKHYDSIVANLNNQRLYAGRSDLLFYNANEIYNQNKINFEHVSEDINEARTSNISSQAQIGRQLNESIKDEYALDAVEYKNVKMDLQDQNIVDPTSAQINDSVQTVTDAES